MKEFGTGSSVFYLKQAVGKPIIASVTDLDGNKKKYSVSLAAYELGNQLAFEIQGEYHAVLSVDSHLLEKSEDMCGHTYVTLQPSGTKDFGFSQILFIL